MSPPRRGDELAAFLRLAFQEPDISLLRSYYDWLGDNARPTDLTSAQRRWVELNLRLNPIWRRRWREISDPHRRADDRDGRVRESRLPYKNQKPATSGTFGMAMLLLIAAMQVYLSIGRESDVMTAENGRQMSSAVRGPIRSARDVDVALVDSQLRSRDWSTGARNDTVEKLKRAFEAEDDLVVKAWLAFGVAGRLVSRQEFCASLMWYDRSLSSAVGDYGPNLSADRRKAETACRTEATAHAEQTAPRSTALR